MKQVTNEKEVMMTAISAHLFRVWINFAINPKLIPKRDKMNQNEDVQTAIDHNKEKYFEY